jgi:NAD(P)-dependent dehydrogenase (short-subunit alcohol dehydrogenase family)
VAAYRRSKLAQIMLTFDLAEELLDQGVTANAVHPATFMDTAMLRDAKLQPMSTVEEGAAATLRLITAAELDGVTGRFFDGLSEARAKEQAYDIDARAHLRAISGQLVRHALA